MSKMNTVLRALIQGNELLSHRIALLWPHASYDIFYEYDRTVAQYARLQQHEVVIADIGAGNRCPFRKYISDDSRITVVGVDLSLDAMRDNLDLDEKRTADVLEDLPFSDGEVDLLVSRSVLEHLPDVARFFLNAARVVKPGGYTIHVFPCRFAPFAIINRLLPNSWSKGLMAYLHPGNVSGFPAYYDRCYYGAVKGVLERSGFEALDYRCSWYGSSYYTFCFPVYLVSMLYDMVVKSFASKNLTAVLLIVARKRAEPVGISASGCSSRSSP